MEAERTPNAPAPLAPPGALHEDLAELAFLLGTWRGTGEGVWPGAEPFAYAEDITIEDVGDTWLVYTERSWSPQDGSPIHFERGFLCRPVPGRVELVLAHPIGIAEVAAGTVRDGVIEVASTALSLTPTASSVTELRRRIQVENDLLTYELQMAMRGIERRWHVRSRLERA
jgi:THAP4-like, heme-binding beta-barrel domain